MSLCYLHSDTATDDNGVWLLAELEAQRLEPDGTWKGHVRYTRDVDGVREQYIAWAPAHRIRTVAGGT